MPKPKKQKKTGRRNDIDSTFTLRVKSKAGQENIDITFEFDPPLAGPAADDQRKTPAQDVAALVLGALRPLMGA